MSGIFNTDKIIVDKEMVKFLLILLVLHASLYTIENVDAFTKNMRVQVQKIRKNNIETLLYLICAIIVFVYGAELGFKGAGFSECYSKLSFFFKIYIASLIIAFVCNILCAQTAPLISLLNANGEPPNAPYPNGVPFLSKKRSAFFFTIAQYLLEVTYQIQTIILSYFSFGVVASYTASYSLGLLSRSLLEGGY